MVRWNRMMPLNRLFQRFNATLSANDDDNNQGPRISRRENEYEKRRKNHHQLGQCYCLYARSKRKYIFLFCDTQKLFTLGIFALTFPKQDSYRNSTSDLNPYRKCTTSWLNLIFSESKKFMRVCIKEN